MNSNEFFLSKLQIYSDTVGSCLDQIILSFILNDSVVKDRAIVDGHLPVGLYNQIIAKQKVFLAQYLYTLFDDKAFHLKTFKDDFEKQFSESEALGDTEIVLNLYSFIKQDICIVRNNISSHSSYKIKGHENAYQALGRLEAFDLDLVVCFLRLIDVKFRFKYQATKTFYPLEKHRDALIMEEIRRKIEKNSSGSSIPPKTLSSILFSIIKDLTNQFYSKGIHPLYYTESGLAFLREN